VPAAAEVGAAAARGSDGSCEGAQGGGACHLVVVGKLLSGHRSGACCGLAD
jgi:hypothetical protein